MDPDDDARVDIQAKVLQSTLSEISSRQDADSAESADCCVICLDAISEPCLAQPCSHRNFDFLCLVSWLQERAACPLCKVDVKEVRYEFTEDSKSWKTFRVPEAQKEEAKAPRTSGPTRDVYARSRLARSRRRREHAPRPSVTPDEAILRRRHVYRNKLYSLHVGSNRVSQYRDLTPQLFESNPELVSRARMWIRRELQVFEFLSAGSDAQGSTDDARRQRRASNAEFLLEYIIAILKTVDIQGSCGQAEDMLQEFLGRDNTKLFLHELRAWLRSPYGSLEAWDRNVQYDESRKTPRVTARSVDERTRHDYGYQRYRSNGSSRRMTSHRSEPYHSRRSDSYARQQEALRRYAPD